MLEFNTYKDLFSINGILFLILFSLVNTLITILFSYKFFQILQQCGYRGGEYVLWISKQNKAFKSVAMISFLSIFAFMLITMAFSFISQIWVSYVGFLPFLFFFIVFRIIKSKKKDKVPLVFTKRILRLYITFSLLTLVLSFLTVACACILAIIINNSLLSNFRYAIFSVYPIFIPFILLLAHYINLPFEKIGINKGIKKCTKILSDRKDLIKIGITGSFAKTSVKEILKTILSVKYKVLSSPMSYNTPLGIVKTVNNLEDSHQVFIAEMGARRVGDIKELTQIINPDIAVITGITSQHLETFKDIENVKKTKYEIIENMQSGKAVFSADNNYSLEMFKNCHLEKTLAGINSVEENLVKATNVKITKNGSEFVLNIGTQSIKTTTSLLGKHNVSNICLACAVAHYLGLTIEEIAEGISLINPIKHRLQPIYLDNGVFVIDDSYNANPEGVISALETLDLYEGDKYIITPGIVELGKSEGLINYDFGVRISKVCKGVILVGRARALKIREGLLSEGFNAKNIYMVESLQEGKELFKTLLKDGDAILFENDLPDKYL